MVRAAVKGTAGGPAVRGLKVIVPVEILLLVPRHGPRVGGQTGDLQMLDEL